MLKHDYVLSAFQILSTWQLSPCIKDEYFYAAFLPINIHISREKCYLCPKWIWGLIIVK